MSLADTDPHFPLYHLQPEAVINDPCGAMMWNDEYHLFYQNSAKWGHSVSPDLVHWRHLPAALEPTPGTADEGGCWSGSAGDMDGTPVILYSGVDFPPKDQPRTWKQVVCLATGSDDLTTWTKHPDNPLVIGPENSPDFRDPCFWKEGDDWYMLVGAGITNEGATATMYKSPDLVKWTYLHELCTDAPDITNQCWECPDFFELDGRHVLATSRKSPHLEYGSIDHCRVLMSTFYDIGTYKNQQFTREASGNFDAGGHFYAAKTMLDDKGRRLIFGWVWEARPTAAWQKSGWSGVISLPRIINIAGDGTMRYRVPEELQVLRRAHTALADVKVEDGTVPLDPVSGDCLELIAEFEPGDASEFGLSLRRSPDGEEETRLIYRQQDATLSIDRFHSTKDPEQYTYPKGEPLPLAPGENLKLQIFIDRSVIEIFANDRLCLTTRIYPTRDDSQGIAAFAVGTATLRRLDAWQLAPATPTT